ncbi:hypothetical protein ISN45_Aa06g036020 [Arabidopsis thaliana x Arabidopsis arenosa]|uniref:Uncharacterized protein n=1 Tax=Arabidopsis thaliana x Arabidopsis arenosa TaxID=1240361 RepID=A0A8T1Z2E9_9BRAS|nr:hypothetical protein ISN45_Aa06g036020 [Arabidopsis thaliana x Arabidopsis arenosa]
MIRAGIWRTLNVQEMIGGVDRVFKSLIEEVAVVGIHLRRSPPGFSGSARLSIPSSASLIRSERPKILLNCERSFIGE